MRIVENWVIVIRLTLLSREIVARITERFCGNDISRWSLFLQSDVLKERTFAANK